MQGNISMTCKIQTAFRRYRVPGGTVSLSNWIVSTRVSVAFKFMITLQYLITNKKSGNDWHVNGDKNDHSITRDSIIACHES